VAAQSATVAFRKSLVGKGKEVLFFRMGPLTVPPEVLLVLCLQTQFLRIQNIVSDVIERGTVKLIGAGARDKCNLHPRFLRLQSLPRRKNVDSTSGS